MSLQKACGIFIYFYIPPCVWKSFSFMVFAFLENALDLGIFTHAHIPTQNSRQIFLKICFPQQQKRVDKTMSCFIKIQSEIMKVTWNIRLFMFRIIWKFLNVVALQFCKWYLSYSVVLSSLPLRYNHVNLTLKLHQKKKLP